jgi:hypothetical protein
LTIAADGVAQDRFSRPDAGADHVGGEGMPESMRVGLPLTKGERNLVTLGLKGLTYFVVN